MRLLLPIALSLLSGTVCAQTFYLGSEAEHERMTAVEGSRPDTITGHLLSESETTYTLRVEGGELTLAKARVWKVEGAAPTVASIEDAEAAAQERLAQEDDVRRTFLARDLDLVSDMRARAAEASFVDAPEEVAPAAASVLAPLVAPRFDPAVGVYRGGGASLAFELEALYRQTGDRSLRRLMRMARRMR